MYGLSWNDFSTALVNNYSNHRKNDDFSDVTLVSDDETIYNVHKLVLAGSSTFFQNILRKQQHSHPLLFLSGVHSKFLSSILDFIYEGNVKVSSNDLDEFLNIAKKLKIEGLIRNELVNSSEMSNQPLPLEYEEMKNPDFKNHQISEDEVEIVSTSQPLQEDVIQKKEEVKEVNEEKNQVKEVNMEKKEVIEVKVKKEALKGEKEKKECNVIKDFNLHPLTERIPLNNKLEKIRLMDKSLVDEKVEELSAKINGVWTCMWCGKTTGAYHKKALALHIHSHIEGLEYPCNQCPKVMKTLNSFNSHLYNHRIAIENAQRWAEADKRKAALNASTAT